MLLLVLAILLQVVAVLTTLTTLVFLMACGTNSSPKQLRELKIMLWSVLLTGVAGLAGGIAALVYGRYGLACLISAAPTAACIGLITWMFITGAPKREPSSVNDGW